MRNRIRIIVIAALVAASACVGAQAAKADDPAAVRAAVDAVFAIYSKSIQAIDVDTWLTLWDDQGVKFVQGAPAIVGKPAIAARARQAFGAIATWKMSIKVEAVDLLGSGYALARGTYYGESVPKNSTTAVIVDGWFMTTFIKESDGTWKIFRDCVGSQVAPK